MHLIVADASLLRGHARQLHVLHMWRISANISTFQRAPDCGGRAEAHALPLVGSGRVAVTLRCCAARLWGLRGVHFLGRCLERSGSGVGEGHKGGVGTEQNDASSQSSTAQAKGVQDSDIKPQGLPTGGRPSGAAAHGARHKCLQIMKRPNMSPFFSTSSILYSVTSILCYLLDLMISSQSGAPRSYAQQLPLLLWHTGLHWTVRLRLWFAVQPGTPTLGVNKKY